MWVISGNIIAVLLALCCTHAAAGPGFPAGRNLLGVSGGDQAVTGLEIAPDAELEVAPGPGLQRTEGLAEGPTVETTVTPQVGPAHESDPGGATAATLETASISCTAGCPMDAVSPVCGDDGLTYMTLCLAICSGNTSITYAGPCLPGGSPEAIAHAAAPGATSAPADLSDRHPVASLFGGGISATDAPGGSRRAVATLRDMRRYAKDGFVLVGTIAGATDGPIGSSTELGGKPSSNTDAMVRQAAEASNAPIEVFTMRLDARSGLLYASTHIQHGGAADLAFGGPPTSAPGHPGPQPRSGTKPRTKSPRGPVNPQISTSWWPAIRATSTYPTRAVGFLQLYRKSGSGFDTCTGALYGPQMIATAGHCLYNRRYKSWTTSAYFSPNHYLNASGVAVKPFGTHTVKSFFWQSAWVTETNEARAYWYDISAWLLATAPSTGYFGIATSPGAYTALLNSAGYPGETVTKGSFHYSAYTCDVSDSNGRDGVLNFKSASNPTCPRKRCPIAEVGQSGSPAWSSSTAEIRGVLSHGPSDFSTCSGWDVYTEISKINFDFLNTYRSYT